MDYVFVKYKQITIYDNNDFIIENIICILFVY